MKIEIPANWQDVPLRSFFGETLGNARIVADEGEKLDLLVLGIIREAINTSEVVGLGRMDPNSHRQLTAVDGPLIIQQWNIEGVVEIDYWYGRCVKLQLLNDGEDIAMSLRYWSARWDRFDQDFDAKADQALIDSVNQLCAAVNNQVPHA